MKAKSVNAKRRSAKSDHRNQTTKAGSTTSRANKGRGSHTAKSDSQIPALAHKAVSTASRKANAAGLDKVVVSGNTLVRLSADGTRTFIKGIEPSVSVEVGQKITLR